MNFPKLLVIVAVAAVAIGSFVYFTGVDRSNPAEVAAAFTKAMKKQDTKTAAEFYMPDKAEAWVKSALGRRERSDRERIERTEPPRQILRRRRADLRNPEAVNNAP